MKRKRKIAIGLALGMLALLVIGLVSFPRGDYKSALSDLHKGMTVDQTKGVLERHRLPYQLERTDQGYTLVVGTISPMNLLREERQLVLVFHKSEKLMTAYEDRIRVYDDFGSVDVELGQ